MRCICSNYGCTQKNFFSIESKLHFIRFITLAVIVPKRGNEWRDPTTRLSAWATQLRRNVAAVASRWPQCVRLDRPGN